MVLFILHAPVPKTTLRKFIQNMYTSFSVGNITTNDDNLNFDTSKNLDIRYRYF